MCALIILYSYLCHPVIYRLPNAISSNPLHLQVPAESKRTISEVPLTYVNSLLYISTMHFILLLSN